MKRLKLPYTYQVCILLQVLFVVQTAVYMASSIKNEDKESSWLMVKILILPTLFLLSNNLPFFDFKDDEKKSKKGAWFVLPVKSSTGFFILICALLFSTACFTELLRGNAEYLVWLIVSLIVQFAVLLAYNSNSILFSDSHLSEKEFSEIERSYTDPGKFLYTESGFEYNADGDTYKCTWAEISKIVAFKSDNMTYDTVHLTIQKEGEEQCWHITEDLPGWWVFKEAITANLPGVDPSWEINVIENAFEVSETVVYNKMNKV